MQMDAAVGTLRNYDGNRNYRSSGEKLIKYQANASGVIMSNSHDHSVLQSIDIITRNLILVTLN